MLKPHSIIASQFNGRKINETTYESVMSFFFLYILTFFTSALLLSFSGLDFLTCISAAASTISNVGPEVEITKKLVKEWFNNNVKIDGFDGNLSINVTSIDINKIKKDEYYRFEINISIEFLETNDVLNKRKIYKIRSKDDRS